MDIISIVNHYWPNTISKLALTRDALPDGIPFLGAYIELFSGASLPSLDEVNAKQTDYDVYIATQIANAVLLRQISTLEATQTPRRIREAVKNPAWMDALDVQISILREQLK